MDTTFSQTVSLPKRTTRKFRIRKFILSAIAILFTIAPLLSLSLWIHTTYFSDPRGTIALQAISATDKPLQPFETPMVSVTFDDGWESVYRHGAPILSKYQIPTTQYILSGQFDHYSYLSQEQVLSLQKAGHDIQSHTITHSDLKRVSDEQLTQELEQSKRDISTLIGTTTTDFASPLNSYDERTLREIKQHYRSHRTTVASVDQPTDKDFNLKSNFNQWEIVAFSVRRNTTAQQIENYLKEAAKRNAWAVLVYHEIDAESSSYYAVTPQEFDAQMKTVKNSGLQITTMDQTLDTLLR